VSNDEISAGLKVRDVMTAKVITVREKLMKQQAARLLTQHRISGLPVVNDDDVLVGVVSELDIIGKEGLRVGDIMTRNVISVAADTNLDEVRHIFVHEHIRRLPVLEQGKVVGIVSRADLVREVAKNWLCPVCGEVTYTEEFLERCPRCWATDIATTTELSPPGS
jgi:CBS domain-containing protein